MISNYEHEILVQEFLDNKKLEDPEHYAELAKKYPVQDRARSAIIRRREVAVGLLGSAPSRISIQTADRTNTESIYMNREEG